MNLVGKILIVLIFAASVCFMAFSLAVVGEKVNWRDEVLRTPDAAAPGESPGYVHQLENANARLAALRTEIAELTAEKERAEAMRDSRISLLADERDDVLTQRDDALTAVTDLRAQLRDAVARAYSAEQRLEPSQDELERLEDELALAQSQLDRQQQALSGAQDRHNQRTGEIERLTDANRDLLEQAATLQIAVRDKELEVDGPGPPRLKGLVLAASDEGYIEVSLGNHDGLRSGHTLEIYRLGATPDTSKYMGRAEVIEIEDDRAVARVIPEYKQGQIRREDFVSTRLQ